MAGKLGWTERVADFLIGIVSPTRLAVRQHWCRVADDPDYKLAYEIGLRARGYKAASMSKNHTAWPGATQRSADAEINGELYTMRNRSRAANRDDALSSGITQTFVRGTIGTGLRPQARTNDPEKDAALELVWSLRRDELSIGEGKLTHGMVQRLRYNKKVEDGEVFLRPAVRAPGEPCWIENIESDRVRTPADAWPEDDAGRIIYGIEKDRFGIVIAYWILQKHPGDVILWDTKLGPQAQPFASTFSKKYFDRVPAENVCHDRSRVTRPGQTRGVPICHAVMQDLRDLDLLMLASLKRTQIAACLAVFITTDVASADLIQLTAEDYGYEIDQAIEPGMIFRMFPGEKAEFLNPAAGVPDLDKFVMLLARRIGSAVGLSPQAVLRTWEGLSYSAARTVKVDDRQTFKIERSDFGTHVLNWEWRVVLEDELVRGNSILEAAGVTIEDLRLVEWIGDEEQWVDPMAEAQATELMLKMNLTSEQIECAKLGRDPAAVLRDRAQWERMRNETRAAEGLAPIVNQDTLTPGAENEGGQKAGKTITLMPKRPDDETATEETAPVEELPRPEVPGLFLQPIGGPIIASGGKEAASA